MLLALLFVIYMSLLAGVTFHSIALPAGSAVFESLYPPIIAVMHVGKL
jgi:hypothetical protein